jgi:hypothetical protein
MVASVNALMGTIREFATPAAFLNIHPQVIADPASATGFRVVVSHPSLAIPSWAEVNIFISKDTLANRALGVMLQSFNGTN